jgi:hypothetical protein
MKRLFLIFGAVLSLSGCAPLLSALMTGSGAPPQLPAAATNISRGALDFALNSFDAALYGLDFAMDAGKLTPGSDKAKQIAKAGRAVMGALAVAEAARDLGNSATYEEAFRKANEGLREFRSLLGQSPSASLQLPPAARRLAARSRAEILDRADA